MDKLIKKAGSLIGMPPDTEFMCERPLLLRFRVWVRRNRTRMKVWIILESVNIMLHTGSLCACLPACLCVGEQTKTLWWTLTVWSYCLRPTIIISTHTHTYTHTHTLWVCLWVTPTSKNHHLATWISLLLTYFQSISNPIQMNELFESDIQLWFFPVQDWIPLVRCSRKQTCSTVWTPAMLCLWRPSTRIQTVRNTHTNIHTHIHTNTHRHPHTP